MEEKKIKQLIGKTMLDIAEAIETGSFGDKTKVGITILGSEHGTENLIKGAELAARNNPDMEVVLIGPKNDSQLETVEIDCEEEMHKKMEELLDSKYINSCVTMHYNFPIGVSTVGKVFTPGMGKEMYLATTTGTSSLHRSEAMVKNALHGIITAKSMGLTNPTVGILNLDGARQVERALKDLDSRGYEVNFAESMRSDGGTVMRGNDLLCGTADVMVTDTLTGNIMMKMFSSFTTGGSYEASGFGYGPGIGEDYDRTILILSRASGVPVVANALSYAKDLSKGRLAEKCSNEFANAKKAGLSEILESLKETKKSEATEEVKMPEKEIVTGQIAGIDIMDLEDAVTSLWKENIYAESGMGCTGPIVRVSEAKLEAAMTALVKAEYLAE
jgi:hypothetical protein